MLDCCKIKQNSNALVFTVACKTETMVVNDEDDDTNSESIITLGNQMINNVKEFKYLGVMIAPGNPEAMIEHPIASTSSKFSEIKDVLINHRIKRQEQNS